MRELTDHIVMGSNVNENIQVLVLDEPGHGNACHKYQIRFVDKEGSLHVTAIDFQNGPIGEVGVNGLTHEALLAILIDRMEYFQCGPYKSSVNGIVQTDLQEALMWLQWRTRERMKRGVEGTHGI